MRRGWVEIAGNVLLAQFTANKNERIRTKRNKPIRQAMPGCEHKRDVKFTLGGAGVVRGLYLFIVSLVFIRIRIVIIYGARNKTPTDPVVYTNTRICTYIQGHSQGAAL